MLLIERDISCFDEMLCGRSVYHAAPLHYLPSILSRGELLAASVGEQHGIAPRRTAARRDRMLGVAGYVHFSFNLLSPLLLHKLARGMPHVVLTFDAQRLAQATGERCALLPFNTKAWRSRGDLSPVTDPREMAALLRRRESLGRYPSLEMLVEKRMALDEGLMEIVAFCKRDAELAAGLIEQFSWRTDVPVVQRSVAAYWAATGAPGEEYCRNCCVAGRVLPIPDIAFD